MKRSSSSYPKRLVGGNYYPIHVIAPSATPAAVRLLGSSGASAAAITQLGVDIAAAQPTVVAEGALDAQAGADIDTRLMRGEAVLLLAQDPPATRYLPFPATLAWLGTGWDDSDAAGWGSSAYRFTAQTPWLRSLPSATVLSYEDTTVPPRCLFTSIGGMPWPDGTAVGVFKPEPNPLQGALIGELCIGTGRLLFCQLPVADQALAGDAFARALLSDLLLSLSQTGNAS
jgi:hypothetical protein